MRKTIQNNPKDRIVVDVDNKHFRLERWDNECNFEIETTSTHEVQHYEIESNEKLPEGGYEFSTILKRKPKTNVVRYNLKSEGVEYYYQPPLTEKEIEEGAHRPEHVVGSYAVYASEKKLNRVGGKEYKCGKVGHIYRPKIKDSDGKEVWGELDIKGNQLTVTIPQEFLDSAVYPVIADPTFGYETAGGSGVMSGDSVYLTTHSSGGSGDLSKMTASCMSYGYGARSGVYKDSDRSLVDGSGEITPGGSQAWHDFTDVSASITDTDYRLAFWNDMGVELYYDSVDGKTSYVVTSVTYSSDGAWDDPIAAGTTQSDRAYSIYATYTEDTGETLVIADTAHTVTSETPSLTQKHTLTTNDTAHIVNSENATLSQKHSISIQDSSHATESENTTLSQNHGLNVDDPAHTHTAENASLSTAYELGVQDTEHATQSENVGLAQSHTLAVADTAHTHTAEQPELQASDTFVYFQYREYGESPWIETDRKQVTESGSFSEEVTGLTPSTQYEFRAVVEWNDGINYGDIETFYTGGALGISDTTHVLTSENITLTQKHSLAVNDSSHAVESDNVDLIHTHILTISDGEHVHEVENVELTQGHVLVISDTQHELLSDNVLLTQKHVLAVNNCAHVVESDNVDLTQHLALGIQDSTHEVTSDNVGIFRPGVLNIQSCTHIHTAENATLVTTGRTKKYINLLDGEVYMFIELP